MHLRINNYSAARLRRVLLMKPCLRPGITILANVISEGPNNQELFGRRET